jgi:hypothetical protein
MPRHTDPTVTAEQHDERPHVSDLVLGLIDARVTGVDFFDTVGGAEVQRMYRRHQLHRRAHRNARVSSPAAEGAVHRRVAATR